ncbi:MAG: YqaE/Pmp3 family membrane protein [Chitinophagaceae bacterium]
MKRFAILLPWFSFFLREKYVQGYIALALQISIVGWPIASLWALITLIKSGEKAKTNAILQSLQPSYYERETSIKSIA